MLVSDLFYLLKHFFLSLQVNFVHQQEIRLEKQSLTIEAQSNLISQLTDENKQQNDKLSQQATIISEQGRKNAAQDGQLAHLMTCSCNETHTESGIIKCGDSAHWNEYTRPDRNTSISKSVTFRSPYSTPPVVHLSVVTMNKYDHGDWNVNDYWLSVVSVTTKGFTMRVHTQGNQNNYRYFGFDVSWISLPQ